MVSENIDEKDNRVPVVTMISTDILRCRNHFKHNFIWKLYFYFICICKRKLSHWEDAFQSSGENP